MVVHEPRYDACCRAFVGLGLPANGIGDVMYVEPDAATFINRQLSLDDILELQTVYGVTAVPEPNALFLISTAMLSLVRLRGRSL